ncbi:hypothetical protein N7519_007994 [Penicillium mononematosum]|uniref:uncharacterized protein n=1 Tax=Penicillium mononematosum TaxID=268346 RepID=UPI0025471867|nr:uncharacterized protein N7519_007994 [Penicillium mononematosum]KAJ6186693.1 hypothetical protein N7519_007994 [Penicillium mononematosum]
MWQEYDSIFTANGPGIERGQRIPSRQPFSSIQWETEDGPSEPSIKIRFTRYTPLGPPVGDSGSLVFSRELARVLDDKHATVLVGVGSGALSPASGSWIVPVP